MLLISPACKQLHYLQDILFNLRTGCIIFRSLVSPRCPQPPIAALSHHVKTDRMRRRSRVKYIRAETLTLSFAGKMKNPEGTFQFIKQVSLSSLSYTCSSAGMDVVPSCFHLLLQALVICPIFICVCVWQGNTIRKQCLLVKSCWETRHRLIS